MSNSARPVTPVGGRHIPELDGIRGVAIGLVIAFHLVQSMPCVHRALPRAIVMLSRLGQTGVDLFFVLSGFLITGILLRQRGQSGALKRFLGRRFLRIFPLYYSVLMLVIWLPQLRTLRLADSAPDWWLWSYLANIPPTVWGIDTSLPHFWSLAVEEQFYLVWPFLVLWSSPKNVERVSLGLLLLAPLIRWGFLEVGWSTFYALPCRMDSLAAGAWLSTMVHQEQVNIQDLRWIRRSMFVVCGLAAVWFAMASGKGAASSQVLKHTFCSLIYVWVIAEAVLAQGAGITSILLRNSGLRILGKYSYGLYVLHPLVMACVSMCIPAEYSGYGVPLLAVVAVLAGSGVSAGLSWILIESPCLRLKEYFRYE